ncbi:MAG TPA: amidase, partial [Polyangiaceae bacterium LLY-WYZ-15_(1-7)]|nr:amidase [Polyangiaceae bacterium LLY-WYZ-15_(1-7)]
PPAYLRTLGAAELATLIRERRVRSREVVDAHLAHLRRVNPRLNALVAERFAAAREEAEAADAAADAGVDLGPLHGVPCTIKECFALEGMPWTAGLVARKDVRAETDATAVARLRAAGAIPLGVTNVSELCMWMETHNRLYGRTRNPYDASRIVGGSSGGEGALVGAGATPFGLGSDVGGSIRMPAFFNGVFGHKPTGGLVPNTGQYPATDTPDALRYLTTGPLARRAADLPLLLRVLAGPDGRCAGARELPWVDPAEVDVGALRVLDVPFDGVTPVHPALQAAQARAASGLEALGARVEQPRLDALRHGLEIWSAMLGHANQVSFAARLGQGEPIGVGRELLRWVFGRSPHTLPALGLAALEPVERLLPRRAAAMRSRGAALREELEARLGDDGVMLYPSYAEPAPKHGAPLVPPTRWVYTALINVLELPATQVPLGLDARGLPLGVQVVAARGRDHLTLAVARALEKLFGGWIAPRP